MDSMDLGEREEAPSQSKAASPKPANPDRATAPAAPPKQRDAHAERTWAARRADCPQWADNVEPF
ncbi:MAG: hypothetical protein ACM3NQ_20040 [Bacteroidales bacterium]